MSTMFSGAGGSSAASVGSGAAAGGGSTTGGSPATGTPNAAQGGEAQGRPDTGTGAAQGGAEQPFFREKIKVDGKEEEISFKDRQSLVTELQRARAANKRFEEGARARKEAEAIRANAEKAMREADELRQRYGDNTLMAAIDSAIESGDPERIKKARSVMEEKLAGLIRMDMMDPRERAIAERERALQNREKTIKDAEAQRAQEAEAKQVAGFRQEFTQTIISALESEQVPNTDWTAAIMANLMRHNMQKGHKLTPEALAGKTRQVIMNQVNGLLTKSSGEQLIEWFPDLVKKIRQADLTRIRQRRPGHNPASGKVLETTKPDQGNPQPQNRYMSPDQWREWTKKRALAAQNGQPMPD